MSKIYDIDQVKITFNGIQLKRLDFVDRELEWAERMGRAYIRRRSWDAYCKLWGRNPVAAATGTVFDLYDDAPTQPLPPIPDPGRFTSGMWTPYNEGDELDRTCKKCGNKSMRAVKIDGNWYAFCKLCGHREAL